MNKIWLLLLAAGFTQNSTAQKYFTKNGSISFFSTTALENIKADNNQVVSVLNAQTGDLQFSLNIKAFHFKKALMEEHFNENYLQSDQYPKASFRGNIATISSVNFNADGQYPVTVSGDLTLHGVTKKITTGAQIQVKAAKISGLAVFKIALADFNITVPKVVESNISKTIEITVNCLYDQKL
jgi:polyisoprenoid-binding protein YceI